MNAAQAIELYAGNRSDGTPIREEVRVELLGAGRYKVLCSPGLVQGIAADDVIDVVSDDRFEIVSRGGNLCVQVFAREDLDAIQQRASGEVGASGKARAFG